MRQALIITLGVLAFLQYAVAATLLVGDEMKTRLNLNISFLGQFEAVCALVMSAVVIAYLIDSWIGTFDKRKH